MAAVFASSEEIDHLLKKVKGYIVIANFNAKNQVVVSGDVDAIDEFIEKAENLNIKVSVLPLINAFHSRKMRESAK